MNHKSVPAYSVRSCIGEQFVKSVPAVMRRVIGFNTTGQQGHAELITVSVLCNILVAIMVDQAFALWQIPGRYQIIDGRMDRDRPIAAVTVFLPACEGSGI